MSNDRNAKELLVIDVVSGYGNQTAVALEQIDSYLSSLDSFRFEAVRLAVQQFQTGRVARNNSYVPTAPEVAAEARRFDDGLAAEERRHAPAEQLVRYPIGGDPPPGHVPLGPIEVAFEGRRIDMRGMDHRTKEFVLTHKRLPDPGEIAKPSAQVGFTPKFQRA